MPLFIAYADGADLPKPQMPNREPSSGLCKRAFNLIPKTGYAIRNTVTNPVRSGTLSKSKVSDYFTNKISKDISDQHLYDLFLNLDTILQESIDWNLQNHGKAKHLDGLNSLQKEWNDLSDADRIAVANYHRKDTLRGMIQQHLKEGSAAGYQKYLRLSKRKVGEYTESGEISDEKADTLFEDLDFIAKNYVRFHTRDKRALPAVEEIRSRWKSQDEKPAVAKAHVNETLEEWLLKANAKQTLTHEPLTWGQKTKEYSLGVLKFPFRVPGIVWRSAKSAAHFEFNRSTGLAIVGGFFALFFDPVRQTMDRAVNEVGGFIGIHTSLFLSARERNIRDLLGKLDKETTKLASVNSQFKLGMITEEDRDRLCDDIQRTLLAYRAEMASAIGDNYAAGRVPFRDGNIAWPITFLNPAMIADLKYTTLQNSLNTLEILENLRKKEGLSLSLEQLEQREHHIKWLPITREQLAGTLVAMKVHEILYPEFSRAEFMKDHPDMIPLMRTYEKFAENFHFKDYSDQVQVEMKKQLGELRIRLKQ